MRYRFGSFALDTETLDLRDANLEIETEPQVFDVLAYLLANRDRVVPKEELLDQVWGDRFVSESALTTRIKQARQAVGDNGRDQSMIRTFHGRGYRFVAHADQEASPTIASTSGAAAFASQPAVQAVPRTHYAESEGASIAYQTFGEGPDLVLISGFATNIEVQWEHPAIAAFLRRLSAFCRVTMLDKRGVGLSDRMPHDDPPSLETRADDLLAVMDAAVIGRATIFGSSEGGSLSLTFAATHPERVERLVLHGTWVRHPAYGHERADLDELAERWGTGEVYAVVAPSLAADEAGRRFLARYERQSATPHGARLLRVLSGQIDVSPALDVIAVPTLVLHRRDDNRIPVECGQELAERISDARIEILDGADHYLFAGDTAPLLDAVQRFVTGTRAPVLTAERVLATVLFVDIVDSTPTASRLGDARWADLLDEFHVQAERTVREHRGEVIKTTGDGLVATFDGPGRGVQAALALGKQVAPLGLQVRAGLHTAEIERRGDDIAGIGVHIASRVAEKAASGEVWVSRTITDLVAGTGLRFAERGTHDLKGLDHPWALFEALP